MAPTKHPTTITPSVCRMLKLGAGAPSIELWFGDATQLAAYDASEPVMHFVATSADPATLAIGSAPINAGLTAAFPAALPPPDALDFRPLPAVQAFKTAPAFPGLFDLCLWFSPDLSPLTPAQAAPYQTDALFRTLQAYAGHITCSLTIPLTAQADPARTVIMLQSLVHSAMKFASWNDCWLTDIRIVIDQQDAAFTTAFDTLAANHARLFDAANPAALPAGPSQAYGGYVKEAQAWRQNAFPTRDFPDSITERQALAIYIYTTEYFHPIQDTLIKADGKLPKDAVGIGYTDLAQADYAELIPLYAELSSGLMNIGAFRGTTFRASDTSWNKFAPDTVVRLLNYTSSAVEYPDSRYNPWVGTSTVPGNPAPAHPTPPPWDIPSNPTHMRLESQSARDIAPYSKHHYEREFLFDHGLALYINSHIDSPQSSIVATEVPDSVLPLLGS